MQMHYNPLNRIVNALSFDPFFQITYSTSFYQIKKMKLGQNVKLFNLIDDTEQNSLKREWKQFPNHYFVKSWQGQLEQYILQNKPDLILCDFCSASLIRLGIKYKIRTVIHLPVYSTFMSYANIPLLGKNCNFFGLTILYNDLFYFLFPKNLKDALDIGKYFDDSLVICSSFNGLEETQSLPPNIRLVGPCLTPYQKPLHLDQDLQNWLLTLQQNKEIVYITLGSLAKISQRYINHLYQGLKKMDVAVIWSLVQGQIPQKNPNFFVKNWLPQVDVINLDSVKVVITHCGWGGISQCIFYQKPMLCLPCFGDQLNNSKIVEKAGVGLILSMPNKSFLELLTPSSLDDPNFTHRELQQKIELLRTGPKFKENLQRLKKLMEESGGLNQACRIIKNAAKNGIDHLIDRNLQKIRNRKPVRNILLIFCMTFVIFCLSFFSKKYELGAMIIEVKNAIYHKFQLIILFRRLIANYDNDFLTQADQKVKERSL